MKNFSHKENTLLIKVNSIISVVGFNTFCSGKLKFFNTIIKPAVTFISIMIPVLVLNLTSCDTIDNNKVEPPPPLPDDAALYLSMDGVKAGLWVLNANSLKLVDSMITVPAVPWYVEFSPDYNIWYSIWGRLGNEKLYSGTTSPLKVLNSVQLLDAKSGLVKSPDDNYLIAYLNKGIDIFDRTTMNLILHDTSLGGGKWTRIAMSKHQDRFYFTIRRPDRELIGFGLFDLNELKIIDSVLVFNPDEYPHMEDADLVLSPDDRQLYLSVWNWRHGGGFNSFFVIDVIEKKIIGEFPCGPFAQLAVSPDGKSVYISNPNGYLYGFQSNERMLRYDVVTNTMHKFLDIGGTDRIVVADDNRTIFITTIYGGDIIKVDANTKKVIGRFPLPLDSLGRATNTTRNITLGRYFTKN
ncbi:hypothetical protein BMS3Abin03_00009 [bacterium BMS3Abin03]|nr:hypothetical protein BMS3Abin03_00009 [bacterium BMS3Abin03]